MPNASGPRTSDLRPVDHRVRPVSRAVAIALSVLALGFGVAGLWSLSPETSGVGLIGFGCLLAILGLLAQASEHFARASAVHPLETVTRR